MKLHRSLIITQKLQLSTEMGTTFGNEIEKGYDNHKGMYQYVRDNVQAFHEEENFRKFFSGRFAIKKIVKIKSKFLFLIKKN